MTKRKKQNKNELSKAKIHSLIIMQLVLASFNLWLKTCRIHVVFGHVLQGQDIVSEIENQKVDDESRPLVDVKISNCGELIPKAKAKGMEASSYLPLIFIFIFWKNANFKGGWDDLVSEYKSRQVFFSEYVH